MNRWRDWWEQSARARDLAHARHAVEDGDYEWAASAAQHTAEKALKASIMALLPPPPTWFGAPDANLCANREEKMPDTQALDRLYDVVMKSFVARGQAPHFTEISSQLGIPPGEGRRLLHELIRTGLPNWLFPEEVLSRGV